MKCLLSSISDKLDLTLPSILIGNIITSIINNQPTSLQVALGVLVREKKLLEQFSDYGVTCTYKEVLRFKSSAAVAEYSLQGLNDSSNGLVQVVADNFDANSSSQNGLKSTHALAMLLTQPQPHIDESSRQDDKVRRLKQHEMKGEITSDLQIQSYIGPKKPNMPIHNVNHSVTPLKILAQQSVQLRRANNLGSESSHL